MVASHHTTRRLTWFLLTLGALLALFLTGCNTPPATPVVPSTVAPPTVILPSSTPLPTSAPPAAATHTPTVLPPATATPMPTTPPTVSPPAVFEPGTTQVTIKQVLTGLDDPVFATHAGDDSRRLFVVEKPGTIRIMANNELLPLPFLDISDRVRSSGFEQGLLGLAFPPNYAESGHFFVNYTGQDGRTVVSRFQVSTDSNVADPASEFRVLEITQPAANHNGGMLAFGPDGYLWIGTGDGGAANDRFGNGQNPDALLGKMLRLDVTSDPSQPYLVPPDNPWVSNDWNGANVRDEVWAVGLRNPWRYSFDRLSGDLWIADVGQGTYEEVNRIAAEQKGYPTGGLNFGWPIMEGSNCFPASANCDRAGLVTPVIDYTHAEGGCSITGGYVYRGTQFPVLDGVYFYGDYCSGFVWALHNGDDGTWRSDRVLQSGLAVSSFGEDETGELYLTDLGGALYQLVVE